jgi:hypothetical protein
VTCGMERVCTAGACTPVATSCADLLEKRGELPDGEYWTKPDGKAAFRVYCSGMTTTTPKEYLSLVRTYDAGDLESNFSEYGAAGFCNCNAALRRNFTKVRLDIETLTVDPSDFTFSYVASDDATRGCWEAESGTCQTAVSTPWGTAANCAWPDPRSNGRANIDLRGTGFSLDASTTFAAGGWEAYGSATIPQNRRFANLSGGGTCGWVEPSSAIVLAQESTP